MCDDYRLEVDNASINEDLNGLKIKIDIRACTVGGHPRMEADVCP